MLPQSILAVKLDLIVLESGSTPMEVLCQSMVPVTVFSGIEGMMELFVSIGEELPHYLPLWVNTAVKFLMRTTLSIDSVCISVSSITHNVIIDGNHN